MHSNLWIFNPDHDMALSQNSPYYMPPNNVKKMIGDLSFLPVWYATEDGNQSVIVPYKIYKHLKSYPPKIMPNADITYDFDEIYNKIYPWGWNSALLRRVSDSSSRFESLPDKTYIEEVRRLSNRKIVTELLPSLVINERFCGVSHYVDSIESVRSLLEEWHEIVVKAPWSGSGRGVRFISQSIFFQDEKWIERVLTTQGGIVVEPLFDKIYDFAMEFECNYDINFIGYSAFETDKTGSYKENILASNEMIEQMICKYVSYNDLLLIRQKLTEELKLLLCGKYDGVFGVDMMICKGKNGKFMIHPCVEINLRMNMGIVSRLFYDRYVSVGKSGRYVVEYYKNGEEAVKADEDMKMKYPLMVENNRIVSGYFSLTPILDETQYQIYVIVE